MRYFIAALVAIATVLTPLIASPSSLQAGPAGDAHATPNNPLRIPQLAPLPDGSLRVIAALRTSFQPESTLSREAAASQQARIAQAQQAVLSRLAGNVREVNGRYAYIPYLALTVNAAGLNQLAQDPDLVAIYPNPERSALLAESGPLIGAPTAWAAGYSGAGQAVAVLDTGFQTSHPFLAGKTVAEACFSTVGGPNDLSACPNGQATQIGPGAASNCPGSACQHGTHVAGIAVGKGATFSGIARDASLIAINVFKNRTTGCPTPPCEGTTLTSDYLLGLEHVYSLRNTYAIAAVNLSLGGGTDAVCDETEAPTKAIVDTLRAAGIATITASGNDANLNGMGAPTCVTTTVSVGSTTKDDQVSDFSNTAPNLHLLAPGSQINSSVPGSTFAVQNGTSMAAPHVAGAWAVIKSRKPNATVTEVLNAFITTGLPVTDTRGVANGRVKPRIRLDRALNTFNAVAPRILLPALRR